ncbi:hypothetical protein ACTS94_01030 [Empedobacter falsenii]
MVNIYWLRIIEILEREIYEELNIKCKVSKIVDSSVFKVVPNKTVFIVANLIDANSIQYNEIIISKEHSNFGLFNLEELEHMDIPKGYLNSIKNIYRRLFTLLFNIIKIINIIISMKY